MGFFTRNSARREFLQNQRENVDRILHHEEPVEIQADPFLKREIELAYHKRLENEFWRWGFRVALSWSVFFLIVGGCFGFAMAEHLYGGPANEERAKALALLGVLMMAVGAVAFYSSGDSSGEKK